MSVSGESSASAVGASSGVNGGLIAGVAVGAVALVAIVAFFAVRAMRKPSTAAITSKKAAAGNMEWDDRM